MGHDLHASEPEPPILVFDGLCNYCSGWVRFILKRDKKRAIRFAPIQLPRGAELMRRHGLDPGDAETILFIEGGRAYLRSDATVRIALRLRFPWNTLSMIRVLPRAWRDGIYGIIARNRYKWFGKRDQCFVPKPEERSRFLDT